MLKNTLLVIFIIILLAPILFLIKPILLLGEEWYFPMPLFGEYIINSLLLASGVAGTSFIFGTASACLINFYNFPGKSLLSTALLLPLALPAYISAYSYTYIFEFAGPIPTFLRETLKIVNFPNIKSIWGAILIMSLSLYPYVYILVSARLSSLGNMLVISKSLGKSFFYSILTVILPACRPTIVTAIALVLMESLADFGVVQFFAIPTFTTGIYRAWFLTHNELGASILTIILLAFILLIIYLEYASRKKKTYFNLLSNPQLEIIWNLEGWKAICAIFTCSLLPFLGFVLPILPLLKGITRATFTFSFGALLINSVVLSLISALIIVTLALLLNYMVRHNLIYKGWLRFISLGYAIPGIIVGAGVVGFLGDFFNLLNFSLDSILGKKLAFTLIGTFSALIYAYIFRFLSLANSSIEAGLNKIPKEIDWSVAMLGKKGLEGFISIYLPLIKKNILAATILVFIDIMKELPTTLILRPFNFNNMATRTYELVSEEMYQEAAWPALSLIFIATFSIIVLHKLLEVGNLHKKASNDTLNYSYNVNVSYKNEYCN